MGRRVPRLLGSQGNYAEEFKQDDLEAWKEEEQKVIDELIQRMQGAYK